MKRKCFLSVLAALLVSPALGHKINQEPEQTKVQIAILLDTSSSMNGLIEQAKTQLWKVVNTFIDAEQDGKVPFVEVALYEYGNDGLDQKADWIRQIQPFTRDLEQVSEELFSLKTNGGEEYCGTVITRAVADLKWDASMKVYKVIFIAGNEAFTQGPIDPKSACEEAVKKGIIVNTIHCGNERVGILGGWNTGMLMAGGSYLTIDHNAAVVHIVAPQDEKIVQLNMELNRTYIPFGRQGKTKALQQLGNDSMAEENKKSGAEVQRAVTKATSNYWNASWDLCDASQAEDFDWKKLKDSELPEAMRELDLEGRKKYVAERQTKRTEIQKEIQTLNKARAAFVAKAQQKEVTENTLDIVVSKAVRKQAAAKGYQFKKNEAK